jgi:hypothetical protein
MWLLFPNSSVIYLDDFLDGGEEWFAFIEASGSKGMYGPIFEELDKTKEN